MEIKLDYTPDELSTLLDALNHGCIALGKIYSGAKLGCELPKEFENKFKSMSFEEIDDYVEPRIKSLRMLYDYLLTFEN